MRKYLLLGGLFLVLLGCSQVDESSLEKLLFSKEGETAYAIGDISQDREGLQKEFQMFIQVNFPKKIQEVALKSKQNWDDFVKLRQKQDLIIADAIQKEMVKDPVFQHFLKQGIREAMVKAYLYKSIPNIEKIKESRFSNNRVFIEKLYAKNKKAYDDKKISKEKALKALQKVYLQRKHAIINYILRKEEAKVLIKLQKQFKIEEKNISFKK